MLSELIRHFEDVVHLPIELSEVLDAIVTLDIQDHVVLSPQPLDEGKLKGTYYQWRQPNGPYDSSPQLVSLVIYPEDAEPCVQRMICAKELVHVCDRKAVRTNEPSEVLALARKLVGAFESASPDPIDLAASIDKLAQYQGLCLLFPKAARDLARTRLAEGAMTLEEVADWAQLPVDQCVVVLDERFDKLIEVATRVGNGDHLDR